MLWHKARPREQTRGPVIIDLHPVQESMVGREDPRRKREKGRGNVKEVVVSVYI